MIQFITHNECPEVHEALPGCGHLLFGAFLAGLGNEQKRKHDVSCVVHD